MTNNYATVTSWLPATTTTQSHLILGLNTSDLQSTTVQSLITRRESFVNNFLEPKFTTPISNCMFVTQLVEDLVTYDIFKLLVGRDGVLEQSMVDQYNIALNTLTRLSNGKQGLVNDSGVPIAEKDLAKRFYSNNKGYASTFNVDNPLKWKVSPSRLRGIAQDRANDQF